MYKSFVYGPVLGLTAVAFAFTAYVGMASAAPPVKNDELSGQLTTHDADIKGELDSLLNTVGAISSCGEVIVAAGSYFLTNNLVENGSTNACIEINAKGVDLDLRGFEISHASGTKIGILGDTTAGGVAGIIRVHNGTIRGFGAVNSNCSPGGIPDGVAVELVGESGSIVENLRIFHSCRGIRAGAGSIIRDNVIRDYGSHGIDTSVHTIITGNSVSEGATGIRVSARSTISGNNVSNNDGWGIWASDGSTVSNNVATGNRNNGITVGRGGIITGNSVFGNASNGAGWAGIFVIECPALISNNSVLDNDDDGGLDVVTEDGSGAPSTDCVEIGNLAPTHN